MWWPLVGKRQPLEPLPPLLAPEPAPSERGAKPYLDRIMGEARSLLDEPADTSSELVQRGRAVWAVWRRPVQQGKELRMTRLEAEVPMDPDTLFELLTSQEGKCIIDPFPREKHSLLVKPLRLRGGDARVVYSEAPRFAGMLRPREYVTCDVSAPQERLFVCKSCVVPDVPQYAVPAKGKVRANLLFAMRMSPVEGRPGRARLQMLNWLDLGRDTVPPPLANAITERWYMQALLGRLRRHARAQGLPADF